MSKILVLTEVALYFVWRGYNSDLGVSKDHKSHFFGIKTSEKKKLCQWTMKTKKVGHDFRNPKRKLRGRHEKFKGGGSNGLQDNVSAPCLNG